MIRLLKKQEVDRLKSLEKKREQDEGLKLARKVDSLRELAADEDKRLEEYRTKTLSEIQKDINQKLKERDDLLADVEKKKEEWRKFFEKNPIDKQWILYVKTEKERIEDELQKLQKESAEVRRIHEQNGLTQKELEDKRTKIQAEELQLTEARILSERMTVEAQEEVELAKARAHKINEESDSLIASARKVYEKAKIREQELELRERQIEKEKEKMDEREMNVIAKELLYYSPVKKK